MTDDEIHALRLSRIAHELRGSAGVALGATSELRPGLDQDGAKFVGMAQRGLERVLRIADRLSRASALQRKLVEFKHEIDDFGAFVTSEAKKSQEIEHKTHIELILRIPDAGMNAAFDREWLGFSLREIVSNAIQHARKIVTVTLSETNAHLLVIVEDDGPGFREGIDLALSAAPNPRRGVGLSLPVCRSVVEEGHGGSIAVANQDAGGARVELRVPRTRAA